MLVICEDCAKKYNIDESRIKGNRARFTCNECGHIIIVDKADLARPLIHKPNPDSSSSPSIDLLKEMEAPLDAKITSEAGSAVQNISVSDPAGAAATKKKMSLPGYFLSAGFLSFLIVNGGIAFIVAQHYSTIAGKQMEMHSNLLVTSLLVLFGTWLVSFGILFLFGLYLSRAANRVTSAIKEFGEGRTDAVISVKRPRELENMCRILSSVLHGRSK